MSKMATPRSVSALRDGGGEHNTASPQMANLLNKTAAAAEEFKRLLGAEHAWAEERSSMQQELAKKAQDLDKMVAKCRRLEELRASEVSAWRKERETVLRDKEAMSARITALMRELDVKAQAEARFDMERKSWAERVERIEKIAADAKEDAKSAGDEVTRLQRAYQDLFTKSRTEKENLTKQHQIIQDENADVRQKERALQEQNKAALSQIEALDRVINEYRRTISQLTTEKDDLYQQIASNEHEIGDVMQQLHTAQQALEVEKEAHVSALDFERSERQRQQEFFGRALAEAESEGRTTASQVHSLKLKVVQLERDSKRMRDERNSLQNRVRSMDEDQARERSEWEETYQQLTEAIATKEMEQDAAAAHLEVMLRSVGGEGESLPPSHKSSTTPRERPRTATRVTSRRTSGQPGDSYRERSRTPPAVSPDVSHIAYSRDSSAYPPERPPESDSPYRAMRKSSRSPPPRKSDADEYPRQIPPRPTEHEPSAFNSHSETERSDSEARLKSRRSEGGDKDKTLPHFMQPKTIKDTGTTSGEVAQFWNVGLRANFHGVRDPVQDAMAESESKHLIRPGRTPNRPDTSKRSGSGSRREWH
jgi:predicted  nucleic acid-binding Zn-ribbon protein